MTFPITEPEPHQPGIPVIQPARKTERHFKRRVAVADNISEGVVVNTLYHITGRIRNDSR